MTDEEDVTARLLRLAGAPIDPPAERVARVRETVHREWRAGQRRRVVRRAAAIAVVAGVAASLAGIFVLNRPHPAATPYGQIIAVGQRIQGWPLLVHESRRTNIPERLSASMSIRTGDMVETDGTSRAALKAADGTSVRVDRQSRVRF